MLVEHEMGDGPSNVEAMGRIAGHIGGGPHSTPTVCRAPREDREHSAQLRFLSLGGGAFDVDRVGGSLGNSRVEDDNADLGAGGNVGRVTGVGFDTRRNSPY